MSSVIYVPKRPQAGLKHLAMLVLVLACFVVVFLRLWYLQVVRAAELAERAVALGANAVPTLAPRGLILDRNGKLLAGVRSELVLTAIPAVVNRNPQVIPKLATLFKVSTDEVIQKLENAKWRANMPSAIFTGVSIDVATRIAESGEDFPGIDIQREPIRYYPDPKTFAHVVGYVATPNDKDIARLSRTHVHPSEFVGKVGVEYMYEQQLMGKSGSNSVEMDSKRRPLKVIEGSPAQPGAKLTLAIDGELQQLALEQLQEAEKASPGSGGAVVAIDPNTGEILCLASNPTYDASAFIGGISGSSYAQVANDPMKPLFNRAIRGSYSPGSTFKIVSTLAAVKAGTYDTSRYVFCPGYYKVGNRIAKCLGRHGDIKFQQALSRSCNTYFSDLAMRTGPDILRQESLDVGLGKRSGIDLVGEGKAVVPTDAWLAATQKLPKGEKPKWYPGDTVNLGIGQRKLSVTPLQMADLAALVAMKGVCYRPHVVQAIYGADGASRTMQPEAIYHFDMPDSEWQELHEAMVQVIENGTGRRAQIAGLTWAGKTGSTEHSGGGSRTHSWFIGFAPADHPRIAIAAIVEQSGHGGEVAAPIAASVVRRYLGL